MDKSWGWRYHTREILLPRASSAIPCAFHLRLPWVALLEAMYEFRGGLA